MRVVFLDFDGVLNSAKYRSTVKDCRRDFIDERKLEQLGAFVREIRAEIVLSTSWRRFWNEVEKQEHPEGEIINLLFAKYGMKIYSKTECFDNNRNLEITDWLSRHNVENYVIFDNFDFFWSATNRAHFVKTNDAREGLSPYDLAVAKYILCPKEDI
jgi:hypothetical protein